ncbi:hypothetical protein HEBU111660_02300 [Helicobacter burdigaliensis]
MRYLLFIASKTQCKSKRFKSFLFNFPILLNSLFKSNSLRREVGTLNLQVNSSQSPREFFCNKEFLSLSLRAVERQSSLKRNFLSFFAKTPLPLLTPPSTKSSLFDYQGRALPFLLLASMQALHSCNSFSTLEHHEAGRESVCKSPLDLHFAILSLRELKARGNPWVCNV